MLLLLHLKNLFKKNSDSILFSDPKMHSCQDFRSPYLPYIYLLTTKVSINIKTVGMEMIFIEK